MPKKDIIKIMNADSRDKLSGLTPEMLEVGELALITETDYERLYCKNVNDEIVPIHRTIDCGEIEPPKEYWVYTTRASQGVKLMHKQEYAKKITLEDGTDVPITETGPLYYTFDDAGEHKVAIELTEDVNTLSECFYNCPDLTSIPENVFAKNTAVTDFYSCFYGCTSLTSIPNNLFGNNTKVTNFSTCFRECSGLTSIPENLFANNTAVTSFDDCFRDCSGLTGSCPVDNDGTPIYNRSSGKEGYAIVTWYNGCFNNCTGLTDYNSIPSDWGGGGA